MTGATGDTPTADKLSAEHPPEEGTAFLEDVVLSDAEHSVEDDLHVIRSIEFDCFAEAEDFGTAAHQFIENVVDLSDYLHELVESGQATADEYETFLMLSQRFREAIRAHEQRREDERQQRLISEYWQRRKTPSSSSAPLPA